MSKSTRRFYAVEDADGHELEALGEFGGRWTAFQAAKKWAGKGILVSYRLRGSDRLTDKRAEGVIE